MANPYVVGERLAGDEISSTYEGRHLTFLESELTHPSHTVEFGDELVNKGDPVVVNDEAIVGVALKSAKTVNDLITIDTEGIFVLEVVATGAMPVGAAIYITAGTGILVNTFGQWFGWALSALNAETGLAAVKVHGAM